jgi:type IV secretory pathway VirB10-like protein
VKNQEESVPDPNDEARTLLDAYARATSPSPAEIERSLTRTLARIDSTERVATLPNRRRSFVWVAAAGVATLVLATAAIAGVRWYRARAQPQPDSYGAAQFDRGDARQVEAARQSPTTEVTQPERPDPPDDSAPRIADPATPEAAAPPEAAPPEPRRRARPKPKTDVTVTEAEPPADANTLAEESRLLARVRRALHDQDFEAALEWAEEHARRHPNGSLTEERLILEAVAACRGDQRTRGLAAAQQLRERFPKAPVAKVEQACEEG